MSQTIPPVLAAPDPQIVFAGLWGALLLGARPSAWTLAGATVIVSSALVLAFGRSRTEIGDE